MGFRDSGEETSASFQLISSSGKNSSLRVRADSGNFRLERATERLEWRTGPVTALCLLTTPTPDSVPVVVVMLRRAA